MLAIESIHVAIGSVQVLRGLSLDVAAGSMAGLIGRNGAGKTTLLRSVMGHLAPSRGRIAFEGADLASWSRHERAARGIGYMPEDRGLVPELTVEENILVPLWATKSRAVAQRLDFVYGVLPELAAMRERRALLLSGGQKLVALARALGVGTRLLLLDEPFEGVAPALSMRLGEVIAGLRGSDLAVLISQSDLNHSRRLVDVEYVIERQRRAGSRRMTARAHWDALPGGLPATRLESVYGDRVVRCFAERPASMHALLERAARDHPQADAVVCGDVRWTYERLDAEAARLADGLAARGVAAGDRVVMFMGNRPAFVAVLFALQRLGAIAVPVGEREQRPGLAYVLQQCGACAVVFDAALAERVPDAAEVPGLRLRVIAGDAGTASASASDDVVTLEALAATGTARAAPQAVQAEDTAVILYTSGTTGRPKGAMLTHLNIAHSVRHYEVCMGLRQGDRSALAVPASHVTGLVAIVAAMVHVAGAIVMLPEFKAAAFIGVMAAERVTHTLMVPAMYTLCLMSPALDGADLSRWRIGGYGGAPMPVAVIDRLAQRLPGLMPLNAYGATETTSPATLMPPGLTRDHADTVGVPLPCADVRVMDEAGRELPPGETGELWIAGPMVVRGYWDNPEATAGAFTGGHWHSGDLGSIDAEGFVRLVDRKKDMLNRGGFKIYSVEVENVLMALPGVVEAAVVGRPCPVLGERVHVFIHAPGVPHDDAAVRAHCAAQLTDYKVPETITWADAPLPRNAGGKLLKRALRDLLASA